MRTSGLVLFICAGLLLSGGAILGGTTSWSLLRMSYYFWITDLGIELGSGVMLMAGALLCLPTCWLATLVPYHVKSTSFVAALMTLATASMLLLSLGVSSMAGLSRALREPSGLNASMLRAMSHVGFDPAVRSSFSAMQIELKCCGVQSSSDWYLFRSSLPSSCCGRAWNGKRNDICTNPSHTMGCLQPAYCELMSYTNAVTILASSIIIVMAVTLFAGAYSLVAGVLDNNQSLKQPSSLRIAYLPQGPLLTALASASVPPPVTQV